MIRFVVLILGVMAGFVMGCTKSAAQDYVHQHLAKVQSALTAEKATYRAEVQKDDFIIILNEMNDTAIWKFDSTNNCYEYILILPIENYTDLCQHLETVGQKVMKDVYINRHEMTFTFIEKKNGKLEVHTRAFKSGSNSPDLFFSPDE